ncbi:MAG: M16 family metallopeptidase [Spirochaetia bacterium]
MISTERLASGASLLLEPVDRTDTLCIGFWFLHGSRDEGSRQRGYSHLLEHMLFKGTARRSALSIAQEIDRVGGIINAFTEKETTCVYAIIPREHLRLAFDILSDMTVGSLLDQGELEKEKEVIINEIRSVDDSPEEKGHDCYLREMWGEHPLARKITGEVEEVQGARRDQLVGFSRDWLVPSNTVIAVAGNFDVREARELASAVFASPAGAGRAPRVAPGWQRKASFVPDRFNQVQIYAGTCYPIDHEVPHYYTSLVFSTAFGESMSCRLFQKLREDLALCYTVYSFRTFFSDTGMWTIYANTTPGQTPRFLHELDRELARLLKEPLSGAEIEDAKSHLVGSMILSREDMETRMKRLVRQYLMMDRILTFEESVAAIRAVTPEAIELHAKKCLRGEAFSLLAYGSRGMARFRGFEFSFAKGVPRRPIRVAPGRPIRGVPRGARQA